MKSSIPARKSLALVSASIPTPIQFSDPDFLLHVLGLNICAGSAVDILDWDPRADSAVASAGSAADTQEFTLWLQETGNLGCMSDSVVGAQDCNLRLHKTGRLGGTSDSAVIAQGCNSGLQKTDLREFCPDHHCFPCRLVVVAPNLPTQYLLHDL